MKLYVTASAISTWLPHSGKSNPGTTQSRSAITVMKCSPPNRHWRRGWHLPLEETIRDPRHKPGQWNGVAFCRRSASHRIGRESDSWNFRCFRSRHTLASTPIQTLTSTSSPYPKGYIWQKQKQATALNRCASSANRIWRILKESSWRHALTQGLVFKRILLL